MQIPIPETVYAGVFPTNSFNAHVAKRQTTYLVLINQGSFELMECLNGLYFVEQFGTWNQRVKLGAKYVLEYCNSRTFPSAIELAKSEAGPRFLRLADSSSYSSGGVRACARVWAHCQWARRCRHGESPVAGSSRYISVAAKSVAEEHDADAWAVGALTQAFGFNELDRSLTCSGILVFLSIAALVEACFAARGVRDDSHPPATERYTTLSYAMAKAGLHSHTLLAERIRRFMWSIGAELDVRLPNRAGDPGHCR